MCNEMKEIAINKAHELYGNPLPKEIEERLNLELNLIEENELDTMYFLAKKLVDEVKTRGYFVSNRGKINSSYVAYLLGITEVNPLSKEYGGFDIQFELQEDIEKYNKIDIIIAVAEDNYKEMCKYMDELLESENIKLDIGKNTKMYDRIIKVKDNKVIGNLEIQTRYNLEILEKLYEVTNINPMQIKIVDDITKMGDILIKNELFTGVDIINLVDAMQEIDINTFDKLINILEVLYNKKDGTFSKSHILELALIIYKIGWYGVHYEKEFNNIIKNVK